MDATWRNIGIIKIQITRRNDSYFTTVPLLRFYCSFSSNFNPETREIIIPNAPLGCLSLADIPYEGLRPSEHTLKSVSVHRRVLLRKKCCCFVALLGCICNVVCTTSMGVVWKRSSTQMGDNVLWLTPCYKVRLFLIIFSVQIRLVKACCCHETWVGGV